MNKFVAFFFLLFLTTFSSVFAQFEPDMMTPEGLRLDGIYVASMQDDYNVSANNLQLYVRFFEDGTVATAPTTDAPVEVMDWLFPGNNVPMALGQFTYKPKNGKLKFGTTSAGGKINYKGIVSNTGELLMDMDSKITKTKFQKVFQFVSMEEAMSAGTTDTDYYIDGATPMSNTTYSKTQTRPRTKVYVKKKY